MNSLKIVYIIPKLEASPQTTMLIKRIVEMKKDGHDVYVIEWTKTQSLHRDKVIELVDNNHFLTLNVPNELAGHLLDIQPEIIHFEELPENLDPVIPAELLHWIYYDPQKNWRIVESSHTSATDAICRKQWEPDAFYLHSLDQVENQFAMMRSPLFLIQFPIDLEDSSESMSTQEILGDFKISGDKKHIVNIGPFTEANNQGHFLEIAKAFYDKHGDQYQFHLVGPLDPQVDLLALPPNTIAWGEQVDVWKWLRVADILLHTTIQDIDPFQCRQAMAHGVRMMAFSLRSYRDQYDGIFTPLTGNLEADVHSLYDRLTCGCAKPKPVNGEDNLRFRQQMTMTYQDLLREKPSRNAVEQPPHQLSIAWHNGPIVTNLSDRECEISWTVDDEHGQTLLSDERQTRIALPLREDVQLVAKWEAREEQHSPYLRGAHVLLELGNNSLGATLAAVEAISQWSVEKGLGKIWLRCAWHDIINWGWYTRKAKISPIWPEEWSSWKPDVDMQHEINVTSGDWLEQVGQQLGIKTEERLQPVTLRAVSRPTQNRYVVVSNQGSSLGLDAWQRIVDIHKGMGKDVLSVGMTLNGAIRIDENWGPVWNALHWTDYLVCGAGDHMWLGISAGKKVLVHDEGQPHNAGTMVETVDSDNILKDEYFKGLEVNK